ncbi:MAG: hypothetical protein LBO04_04100 [Spirochaetaceae bacterium]|nr:hypothetical protein [Spirochaetaceae bacterium]
MKRIVCLSVLITFGLAAGAVFAQNGAAAGVSGKSPYGVITIPVDKIYSHSKGYVIEYRKNGMGTNRIYLPLDWFIEKVNMETPRKGELMKLKSGSVWPYISVYYRDGKTDHVRLYVREETHSTWGTILNGVDLDDEFGGVEEVILAR